MAVAPAAVRDPVRALLASLPGISARVLDSLDTVAWADVDCLWLHDVHPTSPALRPWLEAGGRVLATLQGALLAADLGLESTTPDDVRDSVWQPIAGQDAVRGLAAFGPHPLFQGMQQGASTWAPVAGERYRTAVYSAGRPAAGGVVAVERVGMEMNAARIVAWEYAAGDGGLLCIGNGVCPAAADPRGALQLRALLTNALAGHGIPHRDRPPGARLWPRPGERVLRRDLTPVPEVPEPPGVWGDSSSGLAMDNPAGPDGPWSLAGRRGFLAGGEARGLREAWLHPFRVMLDSTLTVAGGAPSAPRMRLTPDQADRHTEIAGVAVTERWMVALEHPVIYWQVDPGARRPVLLEWTTDLRRSWPYPAGCGGDLELSVAPDGRSAALAALGDPFRLLIDVDGGTLEAAPRAGPAVRWSVRANGPCRVRLLGASDDADLDRSRQMLARRGFAGIRAQRVDHARELASYATSIDLPEPGVVEEFERGKVRMDALLAGTPGIGRCLTAGYGESPAGTGRPGAAWYVGAEACRTAMAQLAAGDRGGPRDTLKFLSLTQDVDGRILEECSTSGLARYGGGAVLPHYLLLAARYAAWTGELDFLSRRWASIRRALDVGAAEQAWEVADAAVWAAALEALPPLAEALGHPETAEELARHAAAARSTTPEPVGVGERSGVLAPAATPAGVLELIEGRWGVIPNALESAVQLAPLFEPAWDTMGLDRLRVGKTVLSIRLRRRFGQVAARLERVHGPRIHVDFRLRGQAVTEAVTLDDIELRGDRVGFEVEGNHALVWHP